MHRIPMTTNIAEAPTRHQQKIVAFLTELNEAIHKYTLSIR